MSLERFFCMIVALSALSTSLCAHRIMRKAEEKDFLAVKEIYRSPHAAPYLFGRTDEDFEELFRERIARKGLSGMYLLEQEGKVLAIISLIRNRMQCDHIAYLAGFVVKEDYQGQGLGTELLHQIEKIASTFAIKRLELEVEVDNHKAIGLFKKMGFDVEGRKRCVMKLQDEESYVDTFGMGKLIGLPVHPAFMYSTQKLKD